MNKTNLSFFLLALSAVLVVLWLAWGLYIFSIDNSFSWARGEAGDFVGGGIGAISVIFIAWALVLQITQNRDVFEAGVFRTFEVLKPELENLSVRIIAKTSLAADEFDEMYEKYSKRGDRTVFLREMQKKSLSFANVSDTEVELKDAMERYKAIMVILVIALKKTEKNYDDDFAKAIQSTEVYQAYKTCFLDHEQH